MDAQLKQLSCVSSLKRRAEVSNERLGLVGFSIVEDSSEISIFFFPVLPLIGRPCIRQARSSLVR